MWAPPASPAPGQPPRPSVAHLKWSAADFAAATDGQMPLGKPMEEWSYGDVDAGFKQAALVRR